MMRDLLAIAALLAAAAVFAWHELGPQSCHGVDFCAAPAVLVLR
jgi:hypothetical protein